MWRQRGIEPIFLLLLIAPKQKNFCVTKDRVPLRGSAAKPAPALICVRRFCAAGRLCNKKFTLRRAKLCYNSCGTVMIVEKNNCAPAVGPCSERNFLCVMVKKLH